MSTTVPSSHERGFLVDTNIWLDYCLPSRAGHADAFALIDRCVRRDVPLYIAATSLKDIFSITEKAFRTALANDPNPPESRAAAAAETAWGVLDAISRIAQVVGTDESDLWLARKYRCFHNDFEDDLILAACRRIEAAHLISNDSELRRNAPCSVLTATQALLLFELDD